MTSAPDTTPPQPTIGSSGRARCTSMTQRRAMGFKGGPEYPPITPERRGRRVSMSIPAPQMVLVRTTQSAPASAQASSDRRDVGSVRRELCPDGQIDRRFNGRGHLGGEERVERNELAIEIGTGEVDLDRLDPDSGQPLGHPGEVLDRVPNCRAPDRHRQFRQHRPKVVAPSIDARVLDADAVQHPDTCGCHPRGRPPAPWLGTDALGHRRPVGRQVGDSHHLDHRPDCPRSGNQRCQQRERP